MWGGGGRGKGEGGGGKYWPRKIEFCDMVTTDVTTTGQAIIQVIDVAIRFKCHPCWQCLDMCGNLRQCLALSGNVPKEDKKLIAANVSNVWLTYLLNSRMARVEVGIVPSAQDRKWNWVTWVS